MIDKRYSYVNVMKEVNHGHHRYNSLWSYWYLSFRLKHTDYDIKDIHEHTSDMYNIKVESMIYRDDIIAFLSGDY